MLVTRGVTRGSVLPGCRSRLARKRPFHAVACHSTKQVGGLQPLPWHWKTEMTALEPLATPAES